jgi:UDP-N-acetyl-D-mannosaminuronic acid dehydrogenase
MPLTLEDGRVKHWEINKIGVIGPGIVGMPMAALLAHARVRIGSREPARVVVLQRDSPTSGWKVPAINEGRSPIGGVEPGLDAIVEEAVRNGTLSASHDVETLADADVVLVCVQTDKKGFAPDYGPLFEALGALAPVLARRPQGNVPLIVFESTLAPSSMSTLVRELFASHGLVEGRDVMLGNSPNRVMPGRLVDRVRDSDKVVAGLSPVTPDLIARLYVHLVTKGTLHLTNAMTAEIVKTLENAYRDVRIAYAAEIARLCDREGWDFFRLRDLVNERLAQTDSASRDPTAVPTGGILVPTVGVGGHCLPKDGILLWWRRLESGHNGKGSLILEARRINDESPAQTIALAETALGDLSGRPVAILGAAYRFDSEDTRNSPSFALAELLRARGCQVVLHDPYVKPDDSNLVGRGLENCFTRDLAEALKNAEVVFACTGHKVYAEGRDEILAAAPAMTGFVDACNLFPGGLGAEGVVECGIGRGRNAPPERLVDFTIAGFRAVERGVANEVHELCDFLNGRYAPTAFEKVDFGEVRRIASTCTTGCDLVDALPPDPVGPWNGFLPKLVRTAFGKD